MLCGNIIVLREGEQAGNHSTVGIRRPGARLHLETPVPVAESWLVTDRGPGTEPTWKTLYFHAAERLTVPPPPCVPFILTISLLWTSSTLANNVLQNAFPFGIDSLPEGLPVISASKESHAWINPPPGMCAGLSLANNTPSVGVSLAKLFCKDKQPSCLFTRRKPHKKIPKVRKGR